MFRGILEVKYLAKFHPFLVPLQDVRDVINMSVNRIVLPLRTSMGEKIQQILVTEYLAPSPKYTDTREMGKKNERRMNGGCCHGQ